MQLPDQALTAVVPRTRMPTLAELMNPAPPPPDEALARNRRLTKLTAVPNRPNDESPAPKSDPAPKKSRDIGDVEGFKHGGRIAFKLYSYERNPSGLIRPAGTKGRFKRDGYKRFTEPGSGDTCAVPTREQAPENDEEANSSPSPLTADLTSSDTALNAIQSKESE
ncbi:hypothetical protein NLJ89_g4259 [Agrocybe chaxingu]|uniref:Uncharacterized protein n=1 Tax=Agrocybe chaxingu TaxID=84603 RepID=A0A9W8K2G7_9AGAR|nr:hypothetical protein NLJ89_g4259 [Agrocybe chaxingu]